MKLLKKNFKSLLQRDQEGFKKSVRGNELFFDSVDALYYALNKVSLSRGGPCKDSPEWLKNKKAAVNPKNSYISVFNMI